MTDKTKSTAGIGRKMRFHNLWDRERAVIVVPKIQRDFAYGRDNNKTNRDRFIRSLAKAIMPATAHPLELDFVFGRLEKLKSPAVFEPIDGQQRLTILFLLSLYLSRRLPETENRNPDYLHKFSYETRDSSTEFCRKVVAIHPKYFRETPNYSSITDYIRDQWWFNSNWASDPTIASMLTMLSALHDTFGHLDADETLTVYNNLRENVDFRFLTLEDLDSTDSLYIKMNSRGKLLDNFEHFKAELDRYAGSGRLSMKIDTAWTSMLWPYRSTRGNAYETDVNKDTYTSNGLNERFENLFYRMMVIEAVKIGLMKEYPREDDYGSKPLLELAEELFSSHPRVLRRIERVLDFFAAQPSVADFFARFITSTPDTPPADPYRVYVRGGGDLLRLGSEPRLSMPLTLLFEAFCEYANLCSSSGAFRRPRISERGMLDRLRILRNLQNNLTIHNYEMSTMLKAVDAFVRTGSLSIPAMQDTFTRRQKTQEVFKSKWLKTASTDEAALLKSAENTSMLYGNLSALMPAPDTLAPTYIRSFLDIFHPGCDLDLIRRALMACGDYSTQAGNYRKYARGDDGKSWADDIFVFENTRFAPVFIRLTDTLASEGFPLREIVDRFIDAYERSSRFDWRYYFVKYHDIRYNLAYWTRSGLFRHVGGDFNYLMVVGTAGRGRSWNPYLVVLNRLLPGSTLQQWNDPLRFEGKEIRVTNRHVHITYPQGTTVSIEIPASEEGVDAVNRIDFILSKLTHAPSGRKSRHERRRNRRFRPTGLRGRS